MKRGGWEEEEGVGGGDSEIHLPNHKQFPKPPKCHGKHLHNMHSTSVM